MTQIELLSLRLVTFNIRYAATNRFANEEPWSTRAPLVVKLMSETAASASASGSETVIGMQEVLHDQLIGIKAGLGSEWEHIGVGRDDGSEGGEYNPILYRPSVLRPLHNETKWLSPTPDEPSFGWGAGSRRLINIGVFEHIPTGKRFMAANTHLDDASSQARTEGIKVALTTIKEVQENWGPLRVSLTGDFNSQPGLDAYSTLKHSGYMTDLYTETTDAQRFGPYDTYTGFLPDEEDTVGKRIDFIWVGPAAENRWKVGRNEVLSNVVDNVYMSDHRAVFGDVLVAT